MKCLPFGLSIIISVTLADHTIQTPTILSAGAVTVTILPTQVIAGDATLTRNAPGVSIDNTPISLGSAALIIGTSTIPFPTSNAVAPIYTVNSDLVVTAGPAGVAVAGNTISNHSPAVTISGEDAATLSLGTFGLVVNDTHGASTLSIPTVQPLQSVFALGGGHVVTEQYGRIVFPGAGNVSVAASAATGTTTGAKGSAGSTAPFLGDAVGKRGEARLGVGVLWVFFLVLVILRR